MDDERTKAERVAELTAELLSLRDGYWQQLEEAQNPTSGAPERSRLRERALGWYAQNMLPRLVHLIRLKEPDLPRGIECLVLLVGISPEPLLISAATFRPQSILLVVNQVYDTGVGHPRSGREIGDDIGRRLKSIAQDWEDWTLANCAVKELPKAQPDYVFARLRKELAGVSDGRVVVDITGGKKSMVTGAFEYAAFNRRIDIAYVDFEQYSAEKNRPLDETCVVGFLDSPYTTFGLRDWEHVRRLYERFAFREAGEVLSAPLQQLRKLSEGLGNVWVERLGLARQAESAENLRDILRVYHEWHTGNYAAAYEIHANESMATRASRIKLLAAIPALKDFLEFWGEHPRETAYFVQDQLEKVRALFAASEDFHSIFIRCHAIHELLMRTRLHVMHQNDPIGFDEGGSWHPLSKAPSAARAAAMRAIENTVQGRSGGFNLPYMRALLERRDKGLPSVHWEDSEGKDMRTTLRGMPQDEAASPVLVLKEFWKRLVFSADKFSERRNELAHRNHFPTRDEARAAYDFACTAFKEFLDNWVSRATPPFDASSLPSPKEFRPPDWDTLCAQLGLTVLPPFPQESIHEQVPPCR